MSAPVNRMSFQLETLIIPACPLEVLSPSGVGKGSVRSSYVQDTISGSHLLTLGRPRAGRSQRPLSTLRTPFGSPVCHLAGVPTRSVPHPAPRALHRLNIALDVG